MAEVWGSLHNDSKRIIDVSNVFFSGKYLFFKTNPKMMIWYQGSENAYQHNFIYDTISEKLISLERIIPDEKVYFLPTVDGDSRSLFKNGLVYNDGYFYSPVSSLKMFKSKEATKSKNPQYPSVLKEYFKTQSRKSNPVIVRMRLKK